MGGVAVSSCAPFRLRLQPWGLKTHGQPVGVLPAAVRAGLSDGNGLTDRPMTDLARTSMVANCLIPVILAILVHWPREAVAAKHKQRPDIDPVAVVMGLVS